MWFSCSSQILVPCGLQRTISVLQTEIHWWCFLYYSIVFVSCAGNLWACSGRLCLPWEGLQRGAAADRQHVAVRPDWSRVRPGPVRHVPPQSERLSIIMLSHTDELYPSKPQYQNMSVKILSSRSWSSSVFESEEVQNWRRLSDESSNVFINQTKSFDSNTEERLFTPADHNI